MYCSFTESMFTPLADAPSTDVAALGVLRLRHVFLLRLIWRAAQERPLVAISARSHATHAVDVEHHLDLSLKEDDGDHWLLESQWKEGGSLSEIDSLDALFHYYRSQANAKHYAPLVLLAGAKASRVVEVINTGEARGRTGRLLKQGSCLLTSSLGVSKPWHDHIEWLCRDKEALAMVRNADAETCREIKAFNDQAQPNQEYLAELLRSL